MSKVQIADLHQPEPKLAQPQRLAFCFVSSAVLNTRAMVWNCSQQIMGLEWWQCQTSDARVVQITYLHQPSPSQPKPRPSPGCRVIGPSHPSDSSVLLQVDSRVHVSHSLCILDVHDQSFDCWHFIWISFSHNAQVILVCLVVGELAFLDVVLVVGVCVLLRPGHDVIRLTMCVFVLFHLRCFWVFCLFVLLFHVLCMCSVNVGVFFFFLYSINWYCITYIVGCGTWQTEPWKLECRCLNDGLHTVYSWIFVCRKAAAHAKSCLVLGGLLSRVTVK